MSNDIKPAVIVEGMSNVMLFSFNTDSFTNKKIIYALDELLFFNREQYFGKHYYISAAGSLSIYDLRKADSIFAGYNMKKAFPVGLSKFLSLSDQKLKSKKDEVILGIPQSANSSMVFGSVRGGSVIKKEGHCIIMGDVNAGAEIYAKGNIIVFGSVRGNLYAGIGGDSSAVVQALRFESGHISIAGHTYDVLIEEAARDIEPSSRMRILCFVGDTLFSA